MIVIILAWITLISIFIISLDKKITTDRSIAKETHLMRELEKEKSNTGGEDG